ncbi:MAG: IS110 family transposase [Planctomycetes bacterium]|nr:IS110 family transposase [Planctomycetota bacterium]
MLFVGIDWSDSILDYHMRNADGDILAQGQVAPSVDGLTEMFMKLEVHALPGEIGIAIETSHGAWVQALLDRGYGVYPVNPKSVDSFRKALSANGVKTDKIDRKVLAMFLLTFHRDLKPLQPDAPEIIALRVACQDRLRLREECTAKLNELKSVLKCHYPAFLGLFGGLDSQIALQFLEQFPTQNQMLALSERRLINWLKRHHYPNPRRFEEMVAILKQPVLPVAEHLQQAKKTLICYLARSLRMLIDEIAQRDLQITKDLDNLPESNWIRSLPGAGKVLAPALLACLGRDPQRFDDVSQARALMGTAPVTKASGKSHVVHFRRGCWKFARRTLQLFADKSRFQCPWAQNYYQKQRDSGHNHHEALRALAHKWLKILLAMKRTGTPYNESVFVNSQRRYLSKIPLLDINNMALAQRA